MGGIIIKQGEMKSKGLVLWVQDLQVEDSWKIQQEQ